MSEHSLQSLVIEWAQRHEGRHPELRWLHSSLNGIFIPGPRGLVARIINHMKQEGMKRGIADLFLPVARRGFHGLYMELKRDESAKLKPEQVEFLEFVASQGYCDKVIRSYEEAVETLQWYLEPERQSA